MASPVEVEIRATGVDGVQRQLRLVRDEVAGVEEATSGLSHSAMIGFAELSRGIAKTAEAGQVGAFAMREFTGAAFRLGEYLGPAGPFIPIIGLIGFAFSQVFEGAQKQMTEMREHFEEELGRMVNAGDVAAMKKQAQDLFVGTPAKSFQDGIVGLKKQQAELAAEVTKAGVGYDAKTGLPHSLASPDTQEKLYDVTQQIQTLTGEFNRLRDAILSLNDVPLHFDGLAAMKITADRVTAGRAAGQVGIVGGVRSFFTPSLAGLRPGLIGENAGPSDYGLGHIGQFSIGKIVAAQLPHTGLDAEAADAAKQLESFHKAFSKKFSDDFGHAIADGVTTAFETGNIGKAFESFGKTMLAGIGGVFEDLGQTYLEYGGIMEALSSLLPDPFTAGPAGLAIGAALMALGASLNAIGQSHAKSGGAAGSAYASQSSVAGGRNVTIVMPESGILDLNNPDVREAFANMLRSLGSTNEIVVTTGSAGMGQRLFIG